MAALSSDPREWRNVVLSCELRLVDEPVYAEGDLASIIARMESWDNR